MEDITNLVKDFGISKKDAWNPADIWGVRGSSKDVIIKVEQAVYGSRDSQTIQQLNALMRGMYKAKELVGVSLKKISGKEAIWEEVNVDELLFTESGNKVFEFLLFINLKFLIQYFCYYFLLFFKM